MSASFRLLTTLVATVLMASTLQAVPAKTTPTGPIPGKFVVKLTPKASATTIRTALNSSYRFGPISQLQIRSELKGTDDIRRIHTFFSSDTSLTIENATALIGKENVEWIEPDYHLEFFEFPQDSLFDHQWYLHNTGQEYPAVERLDDDFNDTLTVRSGTPGFDIGVSYYYDHTPAVSTRVVVAIIDTGVDPTHPELQGRFWQNPDEIPSNGIDDDHNGFVDDTLGYDVSGDSLNYFDPIGDNDPSDYFGHGTHIAGLVAAAADAHGIMGVTQQAEIMAVKIRPNATSQVGAAGIIYAVNAGADAINISWGTPYYPAVLKDALDFARANGVFVGIAAGNTGGNHIMYPAYFDSAFAVAASNSDGHVAYFSTWGEHIDLVAPGLDILSLRAAGTDMYESINEPLVHIIGEDSLYYLASGTSMATPLVVGAAAMIRSLRPDLPLDSLESTLRHGAVDMLDPFDVGDNLPGPDGISGWGLLNVRNALELATNGGVYFVQPVRAARFEDSLPVLAAPIAGYSGGWELAWTRTPDSGNWQTVASGTSLPSDSLLYTFSDSAIEGHVHLRLTDDNDVSRYTSSTLVTSQQTELTSPVNGLQYNYNIPVAGSIHGAGYESSALYYRLSGGPKVLLENITGESFDSDIYLWNASGIEVGDYTLYLHGYFGADSLVDSSSFTLVSAFAEGWPQTIEGRGPVSAVTADLEGDGQKEIIVATMFGLDVFSHDGQMCSGFPVLVGTDVQCVPAVYDIDHDGEREIVCTAEDGIHVFNADGSCTEGWPVNCVTMRTRIGYPTPTITSLDPAADSVIVLVNGNGVILAYEFDGTSHFAALEGQFAAFSHGMAPGPYFHGGNNVTAADVNGDGVPEVIATFSPIHNPPAGVALFDGRTGLPAFGMPNQLVIRSSDSRGTVLADLDGDSLPEIISLGTDTNAVQTLWVKTHGTDDFPGFPRTFPELYGWSSTFPTVADLDQNGSPEILCTFSEFDIGALYVFQADGSPYRTVEDRPVGEGFLVPMTFGAPIAANLTGDSRLEVVLRGGYLFPGTDREEIYVLDHDLNPIPGWPVKTPAPASAVTSTPQIALVDDIDGDNLVELIVVSEAAEVYVWDFDASAEGGANTGRLYADPTNSCTIPTSIDPTGVIEVAPPNLPAHYRLEQNYPNPFNPVTTIRFDLPNRSTVILRVVNILGQTVATLVDGDLPAGSFATEFDAADFASGVYFYKLQTNDFEMTRKMVLLK